jgi:hypothetical protein
MTTLLDRKAIDALRKNIPGEEFDYQLLMDALRGYVRPRSKVTSLLKLGICCASKKEFTFLVRATDGAPIPEKYWPTSFMVLPVFRWTMRSIIMG